MPNPVHHKPARKNAFAGLLILCTLLLIALSISALLGGWKWLTFLKEKETGHTTSATIPALPERLGAAASIVLKKQTTRIKQEIVRLPAAQEWAGSYYKGDGLGMNITLLLAPKSGFVYQNYDCTGLSDQNYGSVHNFPDGLSLTFQFPGDKSEDQRNPFRAFPRRLIPVRWGARHYLVAPAEMQDFCNAVNLGFASCQDIHSMYLLREGEHKYAVGGLPDLPFPYRKYVLPHPVTAYVTDIQWRRNCRGSWPGRCTKVILNAGSADGILPGMVFSPGSIMTEVIVTDVDSEHRCRATVKQNYDDDPMPHVGWKLSTQIPGGQIH